MSDFGSSGIGLSNVVDGKKTEGSVADKAVIQKSARITKIIEI